MSRGQWSLVHPFSQVAWPSSPSSNLGMEQEPLEQAGSLCAERRPGLLPSLIPLTSLELGLF